MWKKRIHIYCKYIWLFARKGMVNKFILNFNTVTGEGGGISTHFNPISLVIFSIINKIIN